MFRQVDRSPALVTVLFAAVIAFSLEGTASAQQETIEPAVPTQPADETESAAKVEPEPPNEEDLSEVDSGPTASAVAESARQMLDEEEAKKEQLRKSAMAGLLVLSLICIVFLVLIILVALWARRIRMLTREPLPEQHPGDPLWYLRKGKGSDSSDVAKLADGGSSHGES